MDNQTRDLLEKIYASQVVIYRKLRKLSEQSQGVHSGDSYSKDLREMEAEIKKVIDQSE